MSSRSSRFASTTVSDRSPFETVIDGRIEGEELVIKIGSGGGSRTERRRLEEPIVLPLNLHRSLAAKGLETGQTYRVRLLDPMTLTEGEAEIKVLEREVIHWSGAGGRSVSHSIPLRRPRDHRLDRHEG